MPIRGNINWTEEEKKEYERKHTKNPGTEEVEQEEVEVTEEKRLDIESSMSYFEMIQNFYTNNHILIDLSIITILFLIFFKRIKSLIKRCFSPLLKENKTVKDCIKVSIFFLLFTLTLTFISLLIFIDREYSIYYFIEPFTILFFFNFLCSLLFLCICLYVNYPKTRPFFRVCTFISIFILLIIPYINGYHSPNLGYSIISSFFLLSIGYLLFVYKGKNN